MRRAAGQKMQANGMQCFFLTLLTYFALWQCDPLALPALSPRPLLLPGKPTP